MVEKERTTHGPIGTRCPSAETYNQHYPTAILANDFSV